MITRIVVILFAEENSGFFKETHESELQATVSKWHIDREAPLLSD